MRVKKTEDKGEDDARKKTGQQGAVLFDNYKGNQSAGRSRARNRFAL